MKLKEKRTLIINADDLGYSNGINEAIFRCHRQGVLRSATLLAGGDAFAHAVKGAARHPDLGVGVHLCLTEMPPAAPANTIPDLVDETGRLPRSPAALLRGILSRRVSLESIRTELHSQLSRIVDSGVRPTHLDTHKHVHLIPQVLRVVLELAARFSVPWIRSPFDMSPLMPLLKTVAGKNRRVFLAQHLRGCATRVLHKSFQREVRKAGLLAPKAFFGISLTGLWTEQAARCLVERMPPGVTEWMMHPGDCDAQLRRRSTRLLHQREAERDLLLSSFLKQTLLEEGIQLRHFGENLSC